jgi:TPR repeat protein
MVSSSAGRKTTVRASRLLSLTVALSISIAVCQEAGAPAKPLRERLLERALKGDAEAQFELAKHYEGGRIGLPQDLVQAAHWYREAADQGDAFAEASLGIFYSFGKGVQRDYVLAYMWLERSASHLTGGDRESVVEMRDNVGAKLNPSQLASARRLAKEPEPAAKQSR